MRLRHALFAGLPLLLLPSLASALDCSALSSGVSPISQHYVQKVLDRADAGIAYADQSLVNDDFFPFYLPGWARQIAGTMGQVIDSRQRLTERNADLTEATACLRFDQILVECKMDEVRKALDAKLEAGSFFAIMQLQSLMVFLQERLAALSAGAADGSYADVDWTEQRLFDEKKPAALEEPLCPFHSDYTPPRMTGYGCDVSVLQTIVSSAGDGALSFAEAEMQGLNKLQEEIDAFRRIIPLLQSATSGGESPGYPGGPATRAEHRTLIGCQEETGFCGGGSLACGSDEFCASKGLGTCVRDTTSPTIPKRSLRGPFSYPTDHLTLLKEFVAKRVEDGFSRTFQSDRARLEDLPAGDQAVTDREDDILTLIGARATTRLAFRSISGMQGQREGSVFAEATDSQLEIADSLSDMRASIGELSRLANQKAGVRGFIVELAYFLRRTCAFRPCQKSLEQIIRIGLQDACFPYTNGEFLGDGEGSPRWKTCAIAACIQVDDEEGKPIDLPESCDKILP